MSLTFSQFHDVYKFYFLLLLSCALSLPRLYNTFQKISQCHGLFILPKSYSSFSATATSEVLQARMTLWRDP